jgi:uncharacterized protein YdaU (DUF1376 family)
MNYYERHLGDYAKDTAHLSMLEHGAYNLLLDRYYSTESGIPADQVYRVARARSRAERAAVDAVLQEFFALQDGSWIKNRCEEEITRAHVKISASRLNGKKGGRPKKNPEETQEKPSGFSVGSENETQQKALQSPVSSLQSKSGSAASADDPRAALFSLGRSILGKGAGSLISKQIAVSSEAAVAAVLGEMAVSSKADPRAYFVKATTPKRREVVV